MLDLRSQAVLDDTRICPAQEVSQNPSALAGGVCQQIIAYQSVHCKRDSPPSSVGGSSDSRLLFSSKAYHL